MTATTTSTTDFANVPHPAGATEVCEWGTTPDPDRYFRGTTWVIDRADDPYNDDIEVEVWGTQTPDGQVRRHVEVMDDERRTDLTFSSVAHVRAFGEALLAAADEIDRAAANDQGGLAR